MQVRMYLVSAAATSECKFEGNLVWKRAHAIVVSLHPTRMIFLISCFQSLITVYFLGIIFQLLSGNGHHRSWTHYFSSMLGGAARPRRGGRQGGDAAEGHLHQPGPSPPAQPAGDPRGLHRLLHRPAQGAVRHGDGAWKGSGQHGAPDAGDGAHGACAQRPEAVRGGVWRGIRRGEGHPAA